MKSSGFEALAAPNARVLILGTLPGAVSLACGQPRNVFWRIMGELVGASLELSYAGGRGYSVGSDSTERLCYVLPNPSGH